MTTSPSPAAHQALEPRRPKSSSQTQTVSVNFADAAASQNGGRRFQLQVSECVETKTITTTTRLTRKFPRVFVRDPAPLTSLDAKEYPLAMKPTPPELVEFSYSMAAEEEKEDDYDDETDELSAVQPVSWFQLCS